VVLKDGKIGEHDLKLFHITDSPEEVVRIVTKSALSQDKLVSDEIRLPT
jgi:hypothetical protein